jgi:NAD(P)-dependent dehydrogenase (short-subunit alcohol dehydrogenase family)
MLVKDQIVLVSGANRGLGRAFLVELLARGAAKVYAGARDVRSVDVVGVVPVELDITDPASVAAAADIASDVTLLINNAGYSSLAPLLGTDPAEARAEMEVNYFGTLEMVRRFAPVLARNGGGGIINVISIMAFLSMSASGGYSASKAALWAATNSIRLELADQDTRVASLALASTDTDMMASFDIPKNDPADVVRRALDEFQAGRLDLFGDDQTVAWKARLGEDVRTLYPQFG